MEENRHVLTLVFKDNDSFLDADHVGRHAHVAVLMDGRGVQAGPG